MYKFILLTLKALIVLKSETPAYLSYYVSTGLRGVDYLRGRMNTTFQLTC